MVAIRGNGRRSSGTLAILVACLVVFVRSNQTCADWTDGQFDKALFRPLLSWPVTDAAVGERSVNTSFQFEYLLFENQGTEKQVVHRWLIEKDRSFSIVKIDEHGCPIYLSTLGRMLIIGDVKDAATDIVIDAGPVWAMTGMLNSGTPPTFSTNPALQVCIDFNTLVDELQKEAVSIESDKPSRMMTFRLRNGMRAELSFTGEHRFQVFPLSEIRLLQAGKLVVMRNFKVHTDWFPSTTMVRCERLHSRFEKARKLNPTNLEEVARIIAEHKRAGTDTGYAASNAESGWELLKAVDAPSRAECSELESLLLQMSERDATTEEKSACLPPLKAWIQRHVISPVRIEVPHSGTAPFARPDTQRPEAYVSGHDRRRTAFRLDACIAPRIQNRLYDVLLVLVGDKLVKPSARADALDLLGEIGESPLRPIEAALQKASASENDKRLKEIHASVRVRLGRPTTSDIDVLREAVNADELSGKHRFLCLESLLLADHAERLGDLVASAIHQTSTDATAERCVFAAGCSEIGRKVLVNTMESTSRDNPLFRTLFFLADTGISPGDAPWPQYLECAERLALDRNTALNLRAKAAQVAHRGEADREFHDQFVRAVLLNGELPYFLSTGWPYLGTRSGGQRFANEFITAISSDAIELRRAAARTFWVSCDKANLGAEDRQRITHTIEAMLASADYRVHQSAFGLVESFSGNEKEFTRMLLPKLNLVATNEHDPIRFAWMACSLARSLNRSLPIDPLYDFSRDEYNLSDDEIRARVGRYRGLLQTKLDDWISNAR